MRQAALRLPAVFFDRGDEIGKTLSLNENVRPYGLLGQSAIACQDSVHNSLVLGERRFETLTNAQLQTPVRTHPAGDRQRLLD